jgi:hypothetical protein
LQARLKGSLQDLPVVLASDVKTSGNIKIQTHTHIGVPLESGEIHLVDSVRVGRRGSAGNTVRVDAPLKKGNCRSAIEGDSKDKDAEHHRGWTWKVAKKSEVKRGAEGGGKRR